MKFSFDVIELVPKRVFRTARTTSASSKCVIVEISDGTITGLGEAAPARFYGETVDTVVEVLEGVRGVVEDCTHEAELLADLTSRGLKGNPSARAALEIAAHDMMGKRYGIPLYRHFELDPAALPLTTMSIGLDDPDVMLEKAIEAADFPMLKVKLDADIDLSIVRRIKEVTGASIPVDANCAWTRAEAVEKATELARIGVELLEQPVTADDVEGLAYVRERADVPVFADESCPTSAQLPLVAPAVDGVVIKLMKCGGLVEAVRMARKARELGLKTMIGCMMESSLAITAAAHISPLMDYADLDSGLLMTNDPFTGVTIDRGRMSLPEEAGLGVHPAAKEKP
jgi:L-alanine-DL-glutamate epimerase-like enolase superfamily enzyme